MESKEKKQVVAAINKAGNILVTVGVDPTVDELSALLGLALVLGKLDKHATAVFSGAIPPAIAFLEPDKTFESTVDGLRDFIIALNKDKADHLRYKLDGDVVKIFITPYKNTIIRDTDLQFSQGDFNVELVIALGVGNKTDLDTAVASHGRILHDATTISITSGSDKSELGEINWHAGNASSLGEMLVSLSRDLGEDLIDEHIATAFMTGIVSNTERFSNNLTTSEVMKTAANLMGLGANQQLIAARLTEAEEPEEPEPTPAPAPKPAAPAPAKEENGADGTMQIAHDETGLSLPPLPQHSEPTPLPVPEPVAPQVDEELQKELDAVIPAAPAILDDLATAKPDPAEVPDIVPQRRFIAKANNYEDMEEPMMGGTLNATTEQAEEDKRAQLEDDRNHVILSHDAPPAAAPDELILPEPEVRVPSPAQEPEPAPTPEPEASKELPEPTPEPIKIPELAPEVMPYEEPEEKDEPVSEPSTPAIQDALATLGYPAGSHPTLADLDQKTRRQPQPALEVDDARNAVANALDSVFSPANNPTANVGSQPLGEDLHDAPAPAETTPALPQVPTITPVQAMTAQGTAIELPPLPPLPPLPGQEGGLPPLPPLPDLGELDMHASERPAPPNASPTDTDWLTHTVEPPAAPHDPGQFHIPGQK